MASDSLGFGLSPFGSSVYGFGQAASVDSTTAKLFLKPDGTRGNAAKIDPYTKDYVLDDNGNIVGDNSVNQMVYLALRTTKNSSVLLGFGIDISKIKTVTDNVNVKFQLAVNEALKHMTDKKLISNVTVKVNKIGQLPGALEVIVNWRDNTNGETNVFKLI